LPEGNAQGQDSTASEVILFFGELILMYIFFLLLLVAYLAVTSVLEARETKKLLKNPVTESIRHKCYTYLIVSGWVAVVAVAIMCFFANITPADIGLRLLDMNYNIWFNTITFVLCGGLFAVTLYQVICYLASKKYREAVRAKLADDGSKSHYDVVIGELMIPRSKREKGLFFWMSATAGIGEEIVWRGFLFFLLQAIFPGVSIIIIILIASVIFGAGHSYQGLSGVIKTTAAGALLGCLFLVSGSLIPGILFHFFVDFSSAFLLSEEKETDSVLQ
jgi:membrane protease YdiL (CAAX protease family)